MSASFVDRSSRLRSPRLGLALCAAASFVWSAATLAQPPGPPGEQFKVVTFVEGLKNPWSMAWLPNGDMLVTERGGALRIVRGGKLLPEPVAGTPKVRAQGQGGLFDVVLHPKYAQNHYLYLSYAKPNEDGKQGTTAVTRAKFENDKLSDIKEIFVADAWSDTPGHFGARMAFDKDGYLFLSVGDRMEGLRPEGMDPTKLATHHAQLLVNHQGKILRLKDDGTAPPDNPFVGREGAKPEIWSYGHRNPQGLAFNPASGKLWEHEHGPRGGDEVNIVEKGRNYGWPVIGYGIDYNGAKIHESTHKAGMEQPLKYWVPSIAPSGMAFYQGTLFPSWRGSLFVGALAGRMLVRLTVAGNKVTGEERLLQGLRERIRDVRNGPDGAIYLVTDNTAGRILRVVPAK
jgi:aldose sugar dehydrogenase